VTGAWTGDYSRWLMLHLCIHHSHQLQFVTLDLFLTNDAIFHHSNIKGSSKFLWNVCLRILYYISTIHINAVEILIICYICMYNFNQNISLLCLM
jgi:hypothetical protein